MTVKCRLAESSKGGGCWVLSMKLCCFFLKCCSAFGSKCELASLFWRALLRRAGDQRLGVSRVKMSVHEVWQFLEDAREANVSMRKLAIVRRRDRQGGIRQQGGSSSLLSGEQAAVRGHGCLPSFVKGLADKLGL